MLEQAILRIINDPLIPALNAVQSLAQLRAPLKGEPAAQKNAQQQHGADPPNKSPQLSLSVLKKGANSAPRFLPAVNVPKPRAQRQEPHHEKYQKNCESAPEIRVRIFAVLPSVSLYQ